MLDKKKKLQFKTWQWALMITGAVVVLLALVIGIWWAVMDVESFPEGWSLIQNLVNPPENDIYYKKSYSVSDGKAQKWADRVVATAGGQELTNGELQAYYWMEIFAYMNYNGYYALGKGLDLSVPLDKQACPDFDGTWQQYFLQMALNSWHEEQTLSVVAQENGVTISAEEMQELEQLREALAKTALDSGYASVEAMLKHDLGAGCSYEDYYSYRYTYSLADAWFTKNHNMALEGIGPEDLEHYFTQHKTELAEQGISKNSGLLYDVRHILVVPENGTEGENGSITYTDEAWEACKKEAQELLDQWLAAGGTEELFAQYANEHSADTGSNTNGGLYEELPADADIMKDFVQWYADESRQLGDYGLIKTEDGYHLMYLSDTEQQWKAAARDGLLSEASAELIRQAVEKYPMEVNYKNIVLGFVNLQDAL